MMTSTIGVVVPADRPFPWSILFAQQSDKDLDFDEGLEDDDLQNPKPPSRRPLLWIVLVLLAIGIAYWTLQPDASFVPTPNSTDNVTLNKEQLMRNTKPDVASPTFHENQKVYLSDNGGESLLMGDPSNTKPGPLVKPGETLTILDGSYQPTGWVYQVRTQAGQTGWISAEKLKKQS